MAAARRCPRGFAWGFMWPHNVVCLWCRCCESWHGQVGDWIRRVSQHRKEAQERTEVTPALSSAAEHLPAPAEHTKEDSRVTASIQALSRQVAAMQKSVNGRISHVETALVQQQRTLQQLSEAISHLSKDSKGDRKAAGRDAGVADKAPKGGQPSFL